MVFITEVTASLHQSLALDLYGHDEVKPDVAQLRKVVANGWGSHPSKTVSTMERLVVERLPVRCSMGIIFVGLIQCKDMQTEH